MKVTVRILLTVAVIFLGFICVKSVMTPIHFENVRAAREMVVVKKLVDLRLAVNEYYEQNGRYTSDLDSLLLFVKTGTKKEVVKEGSLTDAQLEAGMTETKAVAMIAKAKKTGNWKEVEDAGLKGFVRDTLTSPLLKVLYKDAYTEETIDEMKYVPFTDHEVFECIVVEGGRTPLIMVRSPFTAWLGDQDKQELANIKDREEKLGHYAGLAFGDDQEFNNCAGNWE